MSWDVFGGRDGEILFGLVKQRCLEEGLSLDEEAVAQQLRLHVHRGLAYLAGDRRLRSITDLVKRAV
jgi:DNA sulfur modification protein DndE